MSKSMFAARLALISGVALSIQAQAELLPATSDLSSNSSFVALNSDLNSSYRDNGGTVSVRIAESRHSENVEDDANVVERLTAAASKSFKRFSQSGIASWYGRQFHGRRTASGETFNQNALTAAHRTLPLACTIRVTNQDNGKSVVVRVNDRGPFHSGRILDLSYAAAKQIGIVSSGQGNVTIERIQ